MFGLFIASLCPVIILWLFFHVQKRHRIVEGTREYIKVNDHISLVSYFHFILVLSLKSGFTVDTTFLIAFYNIFLFPYNLFAPLTHIFFLKVYIMIKAVFLVNIEHVYTYVMCTLHQIKNKTHVRPYTNDGRRPYHFSICSTYLSHCVP